MVNGCGNVTADGRLAFGDFFGDVQIVCKGLGVIGKIQRKRNPDPKPKMKNQARERGAMLATTTTTNHLHHHTEHILYVTKSNHSRA